MLKRVNAGLFEEDEGADIELAVKATNNGGTEAAQFDYDSTVLAQDTVDGFPGCRITVKAGIHQFRVLVVFSPTAPATARYDLFQVNAAGSLVAVGKSVTNSGGTPLIGFGIDGVTVPALIGAAAGGRRKKPTPPRRMRQKTILARRKAKRSSKRAAASRKASSKATSRKAKTPRGRAQKRPRRAARKTR